MSDGGGKQTVTAQQRYIEQLIKDQTPVSVFLISGIRLRGVLTGLDLHAVVCRGQGNIEQLIYKHAIATILPGN